MSKVKRLNRPIAVILTIAMIVSLFTGIGAIWMFGGDEVQVAAATKVIDPTTGIITVPGSVGALGSEGNPFVVLEIVPSEDMAQFGYLVDGQEPINLEAAVLGLEANEEHEEITADPTARENLNMFLTDDFQNPAIEFVDHTGDEQYEGIRWVNANDTAKQYGYYTRVSAASKAAIQAEDSSAVFYKLKLEHTSTTLKKVTPGAGSYNMFKDTADEIVFDNSDEQEAFNAYVNAHKEDDPGVKKYRYDNVAAGSGNASSTYDHYKKENGIKGEYSLEYKYVGSEGNTLLGNTVYYPEQNVYRAGYSSITKDTYSWFFGWDGNASSLENPIDGVAYSVTFELASGNSKQERNMNAKKEGKITYTATQEYSSNIKYTTGNWSWDHNDFRKCYNKKADGTYYYSNSGRYYVLFVEDPAGEYVVRSESQGNPSKEDYNLRYGTTQKKNGFVVLGANKGIFQTLTTAEKNGLPLYVGKVNGEPVGDFKKITEVLVEDSLTTDASKRYVRKNQELPKDSNNRYYYYRDLDRYIFRKANSGESGDYEFERTYSYTLESADDGDFIWIGFAYGENKIDDPYIADKLESSDFAKADEICFGGKYTDDELIALRDACTQVYGARDTQRAFGYKNVSSNDIFKKYSLGLTYKNNDINQGEDTIGYQFMGWFYEPECVNKFNASAEVRSDISIYAQWKVVYEDAEKTQNYYTAAFFDNKPADVTEDVTNSPDSVEYIYPGKKIVKPATEPRLAGYKFVGWYTSKEAADGHGSEGKYDFTKPVTQLSVKDVTIGEVVYSNVLPLYAGWEPISDKEYSISFVPCIPAATTGSAANWPSTIATGGAAKSGYLEHGYVLDKENKVYISAEPSRPTLEGYQFEGWYWEESHTNRFTFGQEIPTNVKTYCENSGDYRLTLYANWIPNSEAIRQSHTVTFVGNEPDGAAFSANIYPQETRTAAFRVDYGKSFSGSGCTTPDFAALSGNISEKLATYNVKVITVTPKDFETAGGANLDLIDRANLIVINQSCSDIYRQYWNNQNYKNTELFPEMDSSFKYPDGTKKYANVRANQTPNGDGSYNTVTFVDNDLSWNAVFRLYKKSAGMGGVTSCPVMFDYSIYDDAVMKCVDNSVAVAVYKSNFYKLYLMTQQMNPITLYNAYVGAGARAGKRFEDDGTVTDTALQGYWNQTSLIPTGVLSAEDMASDTAKALKKIGITFDVSQTKSALKNRIFIYNNGSANMVATIANATAPSNLPVSGQTEMNAYMGIDETMQVYYRTGQVIYYMLHNTSLYNNARSGEIKILEIEPSDSYKDDQYWFWYISRYIPNFTGVTRVDQVCTTELIGELDDLNSIYDVIYVGDDVENMPNEIMATGDKADITKYANIPQTNGSYPHELTTDQMGSYILGRNVTGNTAKRACEDTAIEIPVSQVINQPFYKLEPVDVMDYQYASTTEEIANWTGKGYTGIDVIENVIKYSSSRGPVLNEEALSVYKDELGLSITQDPHIEFWLLVTFSTGHSGFRGTAARLFTKIDDGSYFIREKQTASKVYRNARIISSHPNLYGKEVSKWILNGKSDFTMFLGNAKAADISNNVFAAIGDVITFIVRMGKNESYFWFDGEFILSNIYGKMVPEDRWVLQEAGTKVYAGEKVIFVGPGTYNTKQYMYASTGNTETNVSSKLLGNFDSRQDDVKTFLYSGNDITSAKKNALTQFVAAGYPIIFDNDLVLNGAINVNTVDSSSNMYRFLSDAITKENCFIDDDVTKDSVFVSCLDKKTFHISTLEKPADYTYGAYQENGMFEIKFRLTSSTNNRFKVNLYFDINGDGQFDVYDEKVDSLEISYLEPGTNIERSGVRENALQSNTTYILRRDITQYTGIIPWKMTIVQLNPSNGAETTVRDEVSGMMAVKDSEKTKLKVLQLLPVCENGGASSGTLYLPTKEEISAAEIKNGKKITDCTGSAIESFFDGSLNINDDDYYDTSRPLNNTVVDGKTKLKIDATAEATINAEVAAIENVVAQCENNYKTALAEQEQAEKDLEKQTMIMINYRNEYYRLIGTGLKKERTAKSNYETALSKVNDQKNLLEAKKQNTIAKENELQLKKKELSEKVARRDSNLRVNNLVKSAGLFYYYTACLQDFEVEFYRISVADFKTLAAKTADEQYVDESRTTKFKDIDMLFIGCGQNYTDISDTASKNLIIDFIDQGKTTLFTYDAVSFINLEKDVYKNKNGVTDDKQFWGYDNANTFRALLGMDRYGVTEHHGIASEMQNWINQKITDGKTYNLPLVAGMSGQLLSNCHSVNSATLGTRYLTQGLTNITIRDYSTNRNADSALVNTAVKTNEGQIVNYPYEIPDDLEIARTHSSYYQLNLEDEDIVVWYTLSDDSNNYYKGKDVRNNYYLYSYKNVVYSGIGHSSSITTNEIKLLINTMISSYRSVAKPSVADIVNADRSTIDSAEDYLYVDFDATEASTTAKPFGDEIIGYKWVNGSDMQIRAAGTGETPDFYSKRVIFDIKNFGILPNKQLTLFIYPVKKVAVYEAGVIIRYEEQADHVNQLMLPVRLMQDDKPKTSDPVLTIGDPNTSRTYGRMVDGLLYGTGYKVESINRYYVDVPITKEYYERLSVLSGVSYFDELGLDKTESAAVNANLKNNSIKVTMEVMLRYGRDATEAAYELNAPLIGKKTAIIMRRGMFKLD